MNLDKPNLTEEEIEEIENYYNPPDANYLDDSYFEDNEVDKLSRKIEDEVAWSIKNDPLP